MNCSDNTVFQTKPAWFSDPHKRSICPQILSDLYLYNYFVSGNMKFISSWSAGRGMHQKSDIPVPTEPGRRSNWQFKCTPGQHWQSSNSLEALQNTLYTRFLVSGIFTSPLVASTRCFRNPHNSILTKISTPIFTCLVLASLPYTCTV